MNQLQKHDHWTQILTEFKQSQLPIKQFCTERSIHYQTLYYWVKKLNSKEAKQHVQPIVFDQESTDVVVLLLPNGIRAELPSMLSQTQIKHWVAALQ